MKRSLLLAGLFGIVALACGKTSVGKRPPWTGIVEDPEPRTHRIRSITGGERQVCALYSDGTVACWGHGAELALGKAIAPNTAVKIDGVSNAQRLSVGPCNAGALDENGLLTCWGYRGAFCAENGELVLPRPTPIAGVRFRNVLSASFSDSMLGIDDAGLVHSVRPDCLKWLKDEPCLRAKITHDAYDPKGKGFFAPGAVAGAVDLTTADAYCARDADGRARCWSDHITNGHGKPFVALEAPAEPVTHVAGFFNQTAFVLRSGGVECHSTDGIVVPALPGAARTAACSYRTGCATGVDGSLTCWTHDVVAQDAQKNPERPAATITVRDPNAHARMVVHDNDTYCTLDEQDLVRCGLETKTAYVIALP